MRHSIGDQIYYGEVPMRLRSGCGGIGRRPGRAAVEQQAINRIPARRPMRAPVALLGGNRNYKGAVTATCCGASRAESIISSGNYAFPPWGAIRREGEPYRAARMSK